MGRGPHGDVPVHKATTPYKGRGSLPWLRDEAHELCEACGRRRRWSELNRGLCRCCAATAEAQDRYDWEREQDT